MDAPGAAVRRARWPALPALGALVLVAVAASAAAGSVGIPLREVAEAIGAALGLGGAGVRPEVYAIVVDLRLPRVLLAAVVGLALGGAGAVFQGIFRNPMADPYVIGVSAGAALGATAAVVFGLSASLLGVGVVQVLALAGALGATAVVYRVAQRRGEVSVEDLLLAGIAVSAFLSAVISAMLLAGGQSLQQAIFWLMGGLAGRSWPHLWATLPLVVGGYAIAAVFARDLNAVLMGDDTARSLGVDPRSTRAWTVLAGSLMAAAAAAASGLVGFVGLIVPHVGRLIVGPDHRRLLPASALSGALLLVIADAVSRSAAPPLELPLGVLTALLGGPFFLYLLRRRRTAPRFP